VSEPVVLQPVGTVRGGRLDVVDDHWGDVESVIELDPALFSPEATTGLDAFSHLLVLYFFHKVTPGKIETRARRPRNNPAWPRVGIFAQRGKNRPNRLGVSTCRILAVDGLSVRVQGLDAVDGTPVLDLKPHMSDFDPRGAVREPGWARELMRDYW
jgi:tRNA-Thr(GGU) m(6)t(6)A37 methyltransferase TsaA